MFIDRSHASSLHVFAGSHALSAGHWAARWGLALVLAFSGLLISAQAAEADPVPGFHQLHQGDAAPDFALPGIDGKTWKLADFKADVLMVYFTSNHCPVCHAADPRLVTLVKDFKGKSFEVVAINPNSGDGLRPDELGYSRYSDSFEDMTPYAAESGFTFPYLYDGATQAVAKAYGCLATPHVFLFDKARKLAYAGAFDDSRFPQPETVKKPYTRQAVEALLAGQAVAVPETKPFGCSTKWLEKRSAVADDQAKWEKAEVTLEKITAAELSALVKNPTKKFRLFNVWALTCQPCVEEFPHFTELSRRMGLRDFELITLSTDDRDQPGPTRQFLSKHRAVLPAKLKPSLEAEGRKSNNYVYSEASIEDLLKALDPEWNGAMPHTVLVAPGGKVVWRHIGKVAAKELLDQVLKAITTEYQPQQ